MSTSGNLFFSVGVPKHPDVDNVTEEKDITNDPIPSVDQRVRVRSEGK